MGCWVSMHLAQWANYATIIGTPLAIFALLFTGFQLRRSLAVERGRFMLEIERMLATHDETHLLLRPGGDWCKPARGPVSPEEWSRVEDYMGLFEHCELLIRSGVLDIATFKHLFSYRIKNILANPVIVQRKLVRLDKPATNERQGWLVFIGLAQRLQVLANAIPEVDGLTLEERKHGGSNG